MKTVWKVLRNLIGNLIVFTGITLLVPVLGILYFGYSLLPYEKEENRKSEGKECHECCNR